MFLPKNHQDTVEVFIHDDTLEIYKLKNKTKDAHIKPAMSL